MRGPMSTGQTCHGHHPLARGHRPRPSTFETLTQMGHRGGTHPGQLQLLDSDRSVALTLPLQKHSELYYYTNDWGGGSFHRANTTVVTPPLCSRLAIENYLACTDNGNDDLCNDSSTLVIPSHVQSLRSEARLQIPAPRRTPAHHHPVTSAQQMESEFWAARLGFCGEWQLDVLPGCAPGFGNAGPNSIDTTCLASSLATQLPTTISDTLTYTPVESRRATTRPSTKHGIPSDPDHPPHNSSITTLAMSPNPT